ncbi:B12-binding domain-containing protein [Bacillus licheniformis]|nr:B12-binding domain-containing protein [Bacillus licheniformis]
MVNGPLMDGMAEVGRLFNNNELIVAEVLQSAEVMKAAVSFLEQYMEKKDDSGKGKIIWQPLKAMSMISAKLSRHHFKQQRLQGSRSWD